MSARTKAYLALILAQFVWGSLIVVIKPALSYVSASEFLFLRFFIILPIIIPILIHQIKLGHLKREYLPKLGIQQLFTCANLLIFYFALENVSALQASLLITVTPVFVTIAGIFLLKEKEERNELIGLIISTIGATLVASGPFTEHGSPEFNFWIGVLIFTVIVDALLIVNFKKRIAPLPKMSINAFHIVFSFLFYGLISLPQITHTWQQLILHPYVLFAAVFAGLLGSIGASLASVYGFSKIEISEATLFSYIKPIIYIPLSIYWLHESVNLTQIIGLGIIIIGVTYAEIRQPHKWFHLLFRKGHQENQESFYLRH
jgi:drug/metabolite transporter (DMT)-like permease